LVKDKDAAQAAREMLESLMEERRWRVPQVADALGISVDIVRRWIMGKSRMQLDDMVAIARLKGADLNEIFGLQGGPGGSLDEMDIERLVERKVQERLSSMLVALAGSASLDSDHQLSGSDRGGGSADSGGKSRGRRRG
jgi:hypothetical protein